MTRARGWSGRKPLQTAVLRRDDPLYAGMDFCAPLLEGAGSPRDYWSGAPLFQLGASQTAGWVVGERGFGTVFPAVDDGFGTGNQGIEFPVQHSIFVVCKTPASIAAGTFPNLFGIDGGSGTPGLNVIAFCRHTTNDVRLQAQNGASVASWSVSGGMPFQRLITFGFTYDGSDTANDAAIYLDGSLQASVESSSPTSTLAANAARRATVGNKAAATEAWQGEIFFAAHWSRVLSSGEMARLHSLWHSVIKGR